MHAAFAFCAFVMVGAPSPEFLQPISPTPDNPPLQMPCPPLSSPQATGVRPAPAMNEGMPESNHAPTYQPIGTRRAGAPNQGAMRKQRMPIAPTDPGALVRDDLPLPPTMNYAGTLPSRGMTGAGPRLSPADQAENSGRRASSQKPFDHYAATPTTSPYTLLGASTNNGTVNTYAAYVRPAMDQQQANQEFDRAASGMQNGPDQPAPTYPAYFLNSGPYYPNYGAAR